MGPGIFQNGGLRMKCFFVLSHQTDRKLKFFELFSVYAVYATRAVRGRKINFFVMFN